MSVADPLRLVNADTGEARSLTPADVADLIAENDELRADIGNLERDLRGKRALITKLRRDDEADRQAYARREVVVELFSYWQKACRHPNSKLTADRFDCLRRALESGYTVGQLRKAIDGAAYDSYQKPRKNGTMQRFDDLELVLRDGKHVESFACRAPIERTS